MLLSHEQRVVGIPYLTSINVVCVGCQLWKFHRICIQKFVQIKTTKLLKMLFINLCGSIEESLIGSQFFLILINDYFRYIWIYF